MTIGKGTSWGYPGTLSPHSPTFRTDADLAKYLGNVLTQIPDAAASGNPTSSLDNSPSGSIPLDTTHPDSIPLNTTLLNTIPLNLVPVDNPPIGLTGGSLWRTIGGPGVVGRYATGEARHYACDLAVAVTDGVRRVFVASLVARNQWWTKVAVVMNAQDMGAYRFGHRAHPGDALLDIYEAHIAFGDVVKVAKRARLGSHLPHPGISERRLPTVSFTFDRPRQLWLDERRVGTVKQMVVTVVPDAFTVVV